MLHRSAQSSGHTIHSQHIESPTRLFFVEWFSPAYINVLYFEAGKRWARVLAETPHGALKIARYHHYRGSDFCLLNGEPSHDEPVSSSPFEKGSISGLHI